VGKNIEGRLERREEKREENRWEGIVEEDQNGNKRNFGRKKLNRKWERSSIERTGGRS